MVCDYCRVAGPVRTFQSDGYGEGGFFARPSPDETYDERRARILAEMATARFRFLMLSVAMRNVLYQIRKASRIDAAVEWVARRMKRAEG